MRIVLFMISALFCSSVCFAQQSCVGAQREEYTQCLDTAFEQCNLADSFVCAASPHKFYISMEAIAGAAVSRCWEEGCEKFPNGGTVKKAKIESCALKAVYSIRYRQLEYLFSNETLITDLRQLVKKYIKTKPAGWFTCRGPV